ncbi:uncharacterized protein LOC122266828, partial [Penaeus japonicus]|uniref:uncharacterized protein LOC122266828 n=1 Tax=Penaeus japonicus TaxID=27405 RepID=UPI001C7120FA
MTEEPLLKVREPPVVTGKPPLETSLSPAVTEQPSPETSTSADVTGHPPLESCICLEGKECVPFRYGEEIVRGCVGEEGKTEIIKTVGEGGVVNRWTVTGRWCAAEVDINLVIKTVMLCPTLSAVTEQPPSATTTSPGHKETVDRKICLFPFIWRGIVYYECTAEERRAPWCATQVNERGEPLASGYCRDTLEGPVPPEPPPFLVGENVNSSNCKFPFVYKGMTYFTCTREDSLIPWCALDVDRNGRPTRVGSCHGQEGVPFRPLQPEVPGGPSPTQLTVGDEPCIFPFQHRGEWHYSCVPWKSQGQGPGQVEVLGQGPGQVEAPGQGIGQVETLGQVQGQVQIQDQLVHWRLWCVTRVDVFAQTVAADHCAEPKTGEPHNLHIDNTTAETECADTIATKTSSGVPCVFPFVYRGHSYCQCTPVDEKYPWCATRVDRGRRVIARDYCTGNTTGGEDMHPVSEPTRTTDGLKCVFPFYYKGKRYTKCHAIERTKPWCPVMVNSRLEPLESGYCDDDDSSEIPENSPPAVSGKRPVFSFSFFLFFLFFKLIEIILEKYECDPPINYAITIWGATNGTQLQRVQKLQNFAVKVALGGAR